MPKLLLIAAGGSIGAVARYLLSGFAQRWTAGTFPVGTLCVNVLGCLAIGTVMGLLEDKGMLGPNVRCLLMIGFLGAFTTLSTLGYETVTMLTEGQIASAGLNVLLNVGLGLGAVLAGRRIVQAIIA
jgi:fluoride exporter